MLNLRSFTKPVTGLANRMSQWLGDNPAVVILIAILVVLLWGGYEGLKYAAEVVVPAHDKRLLDGMKAMQDANIEAVKQMRADNARDFRYAVDAFAKERERDRERDKEREAMMREIKDWLRGANKGTTNTNPTTLARPAGG